MSAIDKFRNWFENRHDYARDWKQKTGGKVMGCICSYVPEELLYPILHIERSHKILEHMADKAANAFLFAWLHRS